MTDPFFSRLRPLAALTSAALVVLGVAWWLGDALWYFDRDGDRREISLLALLPQWVDALLLVGLGGLGLVSATRWRGRPLVAVSVLQAVVFAGLAGDLGVLILLGYLVALVFPLVLVGTLLWGAARSRAAATALATLMLVAGTALTISGRVGIDSLRELGEGLGTGARTNLLPHLVVAGFVAHGLVWAALALRTAREVRGGCAACGRLDQQAPRLPWRVPVTLLAAACALPYGVLRLTWLTGSPWGFSDAELDAEPGVRVMGLLLGLAGLAGATLTIGLLRPWGRRFPRWIPVVGGRGVPVMFPTLTAGAVGAVMAIGGRSMVQSVVVDRLDGGSAEWIYLLLIPLPVWGPALMLAASAYYLHTRARCGTCGGGAPRDLYGSSATSLVE